MSTLECYCVWNGVPSMGDECKLCKGTGNLAKKATRTELIETIRAALDCHTHLHRPVIKSTDDYFEFGKRAAVLCQNCVEKLENALRGETHYPFPETYAVVEEGTKKATPALEVWDMTDDGEVVLDLG